MKRVAIVLVAAAAAAAMPASAAGTPEELRAADAAYDDGAFAGAAFGKLRLGMSMAEGEAILDAMPREERRRYTAYYDLSAKILVRVVYREPMEGRSMEQVAQAVIGRFGRPTDLDRNNRAINLRYTTHRALPAIRERLARDCAREAGKRSANQDVHSAISVGAFENRGGRQLVRLCPGKYGQYLQYVRARHAPDVYVGITDEVLHWTAAHPWPGVRVDYARKAGFPLCAPDAAGVTE